MAWAAAGVRIVEAIVEMLIALRRRFAHITERDDNRKKAAYNEHHCRCGLPPDAENHRQTEGCRGYDDGDELSASHHLTSP